ncbi:MAG: hypothetical protein LV480_02885, partial [Methylacidiphilales bacterium]|nr:hypothetical protein [Candidatus Methylacidiphilales bacterium]
MRGKTPFSKPSVILRRSEVLRTAVVSLRSCCCPARQQVAPPSSVILRRSEVLRTAVVSLRSCGYPDQQRTAPKRSVILRRSEANDFFSRSGWTRAQPKDLVVFPANDRSGFGPLPARPVR